MGEISRDTGPRNGLQRKNITGWAYISKIVEISEKKTHIIFYQVVKSFLMEDKGTSIINTMLADDLAIQEVRSPAATVLA